MFGISRRRSSGTGDLARLGGGGLFFMRIFDNICLSVSRRS